MYQLEDFLADEAWAKNTVGAEAMCFLELLWVNAIEGHPVSVGDVLSPGQKRAQDLGLVEGVKVQYGMVWRFTGMSARFVNRYFPDAQRRGARWWSEA
jgi:hypothetical protein